MRGKTCQHTQGFTLIEILVSVVLITIVASATLGMLPGLARTNASNRDEQRVTLVAKSFFEQTAAFYAIASNYDLPPPTAENTTDGITCPAATLTPLSTNVSGQTSLKRVALTCTLLSRTYAFQRDFARP